LPTAAQATAYLQAKGLCPQHHVVAYCQKGVFSSPRLWWVLRAMGFARVSVLQGGLPAWQAAGLPVVAGPEGAPHPAGTWQATVEPQHLATLAQVQQVVDQQGAPTAPLIVDARSAERFAGLAPEPREGVARGCIPHSLNLPFTQLIDNQGCLKPPEALAAALEQAGLPALATLRQQGVPMVSTCGSGLTACIVALALAVLEVPTVAVFDGSWLQWATEVVGHAKN
jgi:thiosulfate/3-mercaptopyruvate sulfurtransferase